MLVKRCRLLVVLSAVMWTALCRSLQDSDTQNSSPPYTTENYVEPGTPTTRPPECLYGDKLYKPGDYIYQYECTSAQCLENGTIQYEDKYCEHCGAAEEPTPCCPVCESMVLTSSTTEEYTEPETPPTIDVFMEPDTTEDDIETETSPVTEVFREPDNTEDYIEPETSPREPGCFVGDKYYEPGEYLYQGACSSEQCTEGGSILFADVFCDHGNCNYKDEPNACCPACKYNPIRTPRIEPETPPMTESVPEPDTTGDYIEPDTTTAAPDTTEHCTTPEMPPTEPPSTEPPGCNYGNKHYEIGEYISYQPCTSVRCTINGPVNEGTLCQTDAGCNTDWPANDCCPACPFETTTAVAEEPAPGRSPGKSIPLRRGDYEARSRRRRNLERSKVKRHAFRVSGKRYRLIRKRFAFVKP